MRVTVSARARRERHPIRGRGRRRIVGVAEGVQLLVDPRPRDWREVATFLAPVRRSDSIAFTPTAAQGMKQNRVGVEVGPRHQNSYRKIKVGQSCPGSSRANERIALARPQVRARGFCRTVGGQHADGLRFSRRLNRDRGQREAWSVNANGSRTPRRTAAASPSEREHLDRGRGGLAGGQRRQGQARFARRRSRRLTPPSAPRGVARITGMLSIPACGLFIAKFGGVTVSAVLAPLWRVLAFPIAGVHVGRSCSQAARFPSRRGVSHRWRRPDHDAVARRAARFR
jgi:hypothetical protein